MPKVLLMILDGYGYDESTYFNAVKDANTPFLDEAFTKNPHSFLCASGRPVGLPDGIMGNSEVGHLNIGAGRVVYQDLTRITKSIENGDFFENGAFCEAAAHIKKTGGALHLMGLVSDGGVHSARGHYEALIQFAKKNGVKKLFVHCFTDGRDTPPESALGYIKELESYLTQTGIGKIATVSGRYYAMDRDNRYERVRLAYDALISGEGAKALSAAAAVSESYQNGVTDEFILPTVIVSEDKPVATIRGGDSVIFFNFRADRARQITAAITQKAFDGFERSQIAEVKFVCMTQYETGLKNTVVAYGPQNINNTLGEYLSVLGKAQLRIAETEKYAHVTYFFNGGVEGAYKNEDRILIPSPKVATYDLKPEMSAYEVAGTLIENIRRGSYDFILVNFANCDMVGHTGNFEATLETVEVVDKCAAEVCGAALDSGYRVFITADHGNAEQMMAGGVKQTAHTTNSVQIALLGSDAKSLSGGSLCDVAPSVLDELRLEKPADMTGKSLIER